MKSLIINADDFNMSTVFNEKILELIEKDMITSTTVLIDYNENKEQFQRLKRLGKQHNISIGLHLMFPDNDFEKHIKTQYKKFLEHFEQEPSHLDIHKPKFDPKSAEQWRDMDQLVYEFCIKKNLPCRNHGKTLKESITTSGFRFVGTVKDFNEIEEWLKTLEDNKTYEILFHPGIFDPDCISSLNKNRELDAKHIKILNTKLEQYDIKKISFYDLSSL